MQDIAHHLTGIGYQRHEPVEVLGEFSIRGGILDVFPAEAERPVRMEFFGDLIESMRTFDIETQRSVLKISEVTLLPLSEGKGEAASSLVEQAQGALIVIDEPEQTAGAAERLWKRLEEEDEASFLTWDDFRARIEPLTRLELRELDLEQPLTPRIPCRPTMAFHGNMQVAVAEARTLVEQGNRVVFFAASLGEVERLADIFQEYSVPYQLVWTRPTRLRRIWLQRPYMPSAASILLARGPCAPRRHPARQPRGDLRLGGSVRSLRADRPREQVRSGQMRRVRRRHRRPEAGRLRRPRHARRRQVPRHPRNRAGRAEGRFHAARVRRRAPSCMSR